MAEDQKATDSKALARELVSQHWHRVLNLPEETWRSIADQVVDSSWLADRFTRKEDSQ